MQGRLAVAAVVPCDVKSCPSTCQNFTLMVTKLCNIDKVVSRDGN